MALSHSRILTQGANIIEEFIIRDIISDVTPTTAASSTAVPTAGIPRYGVTITAYAAAVYVKAVKKGAANPNASSSNYTWVVPLGTSRDIKLGKGIDLWVQTSDNYGFSEWV